MNISLLANDLGNLKKTFTSCTETGNHKYYMYTYTTVAALKYFLRNAKKKKKLYNLMFGLFRFVHEKLIFKNNKIKRSYNKSYLCPLLRS